MKGTLRRRLAATLVVVLAVGALIAATDATASVATTSAIAFSGDNPCTGEPFVGNGQLHFLTDSNLSVDGMTQSHFEANLQGLQATTATGKKYVVMDTTTETLVFDTADLMPYHEKLEWTAQFIRQGEDGGLITGDDYFEHFLAHVTVNANGLVTVDDFTFDNYCK
jgi:hypothetical protein